MVTGKALVLLVSPGDMDWAVTGGILCVSIFRTERLMFLPIRMGYQEGQQRASWSGKEGRGQHCCPIRPKNKSI